MAKIEIGVKAIADQIDKLTDKRWSYTVGKGYAVMPDVYSTSPIFTIEPTDVISEKEAIEVVKALFIRHIKPTILSAKVVLDKVTAEDAKFVIDFHVEKTNEIRNSTSNKVKTQDEKLFDSFISINPNDSEINRLFNQLAAFQR
jgi:hypothetical protein